MEFIGIILVSTFISAFLFASYQFGFYMGKRDANNDGVTVTEANKEFVEEMQRWKNYSGRR